MAKPIIGVLPLYDAANDKYWMRPGYMKGVEAAGGIPFMLPLTADLDNIGRIAEMFDGFLFTGGQDIHPELYGEKPEAFCGEVCRERDVLEIALFRRALELDKPMFGICRGLQLFNVALGGTLYQDLPAQYPSGAGIAHRQTEPHPVPTHDVFIEKDSLLYGMFGTETVKVNSIHHQGIRKLSEYLAPAARAADGLIEAVVMPGKRYVAAVQWHPEYTYDSDPCSYKLFERLVQACGK